MTTMGEQLHAILNDKYGGRKNFGDVMDELFLEDKVYWWMTEVFQRSLLIRIGCPTTAQT
jgi:hypothetical protein